MIGLLRRLLSRGAAEPKPAGSDAGVPWYMRQTAEVTPDRIEAARQRLKQAIPPPQPPDSESGD